MGGMVGKTGKTLHQLQHEGDDTAVHRNLRPRPTNLAARLPCHLVAVDCFSSFGHLLKTPCHPALGGAQLYVQSIVILHRHQFTANHIGRGTLQPGQQSGLQTVRVTRRINDNKTSETFSTSKRTPYWATRQVRPPSGARN